MAANNAVDRTASELDDHLTSIDTLQSQHLETYRDPFHTSHLERLAIGGGGKIVNGRVQFMLPHIGWYRVALEGLQGVIPCCMAQYGTTGDVIGPHSSSCIPPGSEVLVQLYQQPIGHHGVIICVVPPHQTDGNVLFSDWIGQGSDTGIRKEKHYYNYLELLQDEGGTINFSSHSPMDQTTFDHGVMCETGVGYHVDPFYTFLRTDEVNGVFFSYLEQHGLFAAYNWESQSSCHVEEAYDDDGELAAYRGSSLYTWEMNGGFGQEAEVFRKEDLGDVQFFKPVASCEPKEDNQVPFCRFEVWGGYLGQGHTQFVSVPPKDAEQGVNALGDEGLIPVGLYQKTIAPDGSETTASAKSITLVKKAIITPPMRKRLHNDAREDSDNPKNYRSSGVHGEDGPEHKVQADFFAGQLDPFADDTRHLLTAATVLDTIHYNLGWKNTHPFHYHTGDFVYQDEKDSAFDTNQTIPNFSGLKQSFWLPRPDAETVKVDEKYGDVDIFKVLSMFHLADDGSVIIQGGGGEEIKFTGGKILLSAPGGIYAMPGQSFAVLAGDDIILRANNSVDVTSTNKDVRVKAEKNMQLLSGNGGSGGTLIENKAQDTTQEYPGEGGEAIQASGVILKAANSVIAGMGSEIYLRTGTGTIQAGPITLDANKGEGVGVVRILGQNIHKFVNSNERLAIGVGKIQEVCQFKRGQIDLGDNVAVHGQLHVNGRILNTAGIRISDGHITTPNGGDVGRERNPGVVREAVVEVADRTNEVKEQLQDDYDNEIKEKYYEQGKIGNEDQQQKISVSLREEAEYGTQQFTLPQAHWQQLAEEGGSKTYWAENNVMYQDQRNQQPWPGKKKWSEETTLHTFPNADRPVYDIATGLAKERGEDWEDIEIGSLTSKTPESSYNII